MFMARPGAERLAGASGQQTHVPQDRIYWPQDQPEDDLDFVMYGNRSVDGEIHVREMIGDDQQVIESRS
jgi:hypothetical protein